MAGYAALAVGVDLEVEGVQPVHPLRGLGDEQEVLPVVHVLGEHLRRLVRPHRLSVDPAEQ